MRTPGTPETQQTPRMPGTTGLPRTGRHWAPAAVLAAVAVVVALSTGVPFAAVFILAVALMCPLLMVIMLHALRAPRRGGFQVRPPDSPSRG
ncbi:hypothetical protein ACIP98_19395 [Streptomyces sp. NPDC088354]|uniref:hypothetical protein n=1 Tax=Streptomyces sp. NPDC088354 TaxID=3365856 RepID=UPI00380EC596